MLLYFSVSLVFLKHLKHLRFTVHLSAGCISKSLVQQRDFIIFNVKHLNRVNGTSCLLVAGLVPWLSQNASGSQFINVSADSQCPYHIGVFSLATGPPESLVKHQKWRVCAIGVIAIAGDGLNTIREMLMAIFRAGFGAGTCSALAEPPAPSSALSIGCSVPTCPWRCRISGVCRAPHEVAMLISLARASRRGAPRCCRFFYAQSPANNHLPSLNAGPVRRTVPRGSDNAP